MLYGPLKYHLGRHYTRFWNRTIAILLLLAMICFSLVGFVSSPHRSPSAATTKISPQRVRPLALLDPRGKRGSAAERSKAPQRLREHRANAEDRALSIPAALSQGRLQGLGEKTKPLSGEGRFLVKQGDGEP